MIVENKPAEYRVTYMAGERLREAFMNQRELDDCRSRCEVIEAIRVGA